MKFLPSEYQDFIQIFSKNGIAENQVKFIKKKGNLHIYFNEREIIYHREKVTGFDSSGNWLEETKYLLRENDVDWIPLSSWQDTLESLQSMIG